MVKRIVRIRVLSFFVLLAPCVSFSQSGHLPADLVQDLQVDGLNSPAAQGQEMGRKMRTWTSLPDAPSAQPTTRAEKFQTFVDEARSPLTLGAVGINAVLMRETDLGVIPKPHLIDLYKVVLIQKESSAFFGKYLYPSLLKQDPRYYPSTSRSFLGRATYAASRILITRNDSGERRLNTSYFLGVLTSVAIATAYRPYWARSPSTTFKAFGSTIGSDAGVNLFHEFGPGIRQMVKHHTPKFVSRIEERFTRDQSPSYVVYSPAR